MVGALNHLSERGVGSLRTAESVPALPHVDRALLSPNQQDALRMIESAAAEAPLCGPEFCGEASLRAMLAAGSNYGSAGQLSSYREGAVSLPKDQSSGVEMAGVLEGDAREAVENVGEKMLLSNEEREAMLMSGELPNTYHDVVFQHSRRKYCRFIATL
jgi:hypothetical protein